MDSGPRQLGLQPDEHPRHRKRVAAQVEEVRVTRHGIHAEHVPVRGDDDVLDATCGPEPGTRATVAGDGQRQRVRQRPAVRLSARIARDLLDNREDGRQVLRRRDSTQPPPHGDRVQVGACLRHEPGREPARGSAFVEHEGERVQQRELVTQQRVDSREADPVRRDRHLVAAAAHDLDASVGESPPTVGGRVPAAVRAGSGAEAGRDREVHVAAVTECQRRGLDHDLADLAHRRIPAGAAFDEQPRPGHPVAHRDRAAPGQRVRIDSGERGELRCLGGAVPVGQLRARREAVGGSDVARAQGIAGADEQPQAREGGAGCRAQRPQQGRGQVRDGHPLHRQPGPQLPWRAQVTGRRHDHLGRGGQRGEDVAQHRVVAEPGEQRDPVAPVERRQVAVGGQRGSQLRVPAAHGARRRGRPGW